MTFPPLVRQNFVADRKEDRTRLRSGLLGVVVLDSAGNLAGRQAQSLLCARSLHVVEHPAALVPIDRAIDTPGFEFLTLLGGAALVTMVQPADFRKLHHFPKFRTLHLPLDGRFLVQPHNGEPYEVKVGRVILTGSILRPDFPWDELQEKGLVQDVLNHYATNDPVVPWAHLTIWESGPSGRRGFDPPTSPNQSLEVINVTAAPKGHSGALSGQERYGNYSEIWTPFLTNPVGQASSGLATKVPKRPWHAAWLPLRGSLFPLVAIPLLVALLAWGFVNLGPSITALRDNIAGFLGTAARYLGLAAAGMFVLYILQKIWCRVTKG